MSLGTTREKTDDGSVDGHGLIRFVLYCERMGHSDPGIEEIPIEHDGLLEILAGNFVFLAVEVVGAH